MQLYARQHHDSALRQFPHTVLFAARPAVSPGLLANGHRVCHRHHTLPFTVHLLETVIMERPDRLVFPNADGFTQLWETKVFMFATLLTIYFLSSRKKRKRLWRISREHKLLTYCLLYSFCAIPFAPLGIDSAISGVCFFCMFWRCSCSNSF